MQLSRYETTDPPQYFKQIMNNLIMVQQYRYLKIEKPSLVNNTVLSKPQQSYKPFEIEVKPLKYELIKKRIIKRVREEKIDSKMEKKAQRLLNVHLVHKLNQATLEAVQHRIPPPFSILDTKEQGDYLPEGEKKQFPHFSNTLKPTEIPPVCPASYRPKTVKLKQPPVFGIEQNCVFKIKKLYQFPKLLFRLGNEQFDGIAEEMMSSECNVKLLYDLFNDYFNVEDRIDIRGEEPRKKYIKKIKRYIMKAVNKYKKSQNCSSVYVPSEEQFVSLKDIRIILNAKRQESQSSDED